MGHRSNRAVAILSSLVALIWLWAPAAHAGRPGHRTRRHPLRPGHHQAKAADAQSRALHKRAPSKAARNARAHTRQAR